MIGWQDSPCELWTGAVSGAGYGHCAIDGRNVQVHRLSWEAFYGPIPAELEINHLCRNKRCYNPLHLEAVTHSQNEFYKNSVITHCPRGHVYDEANTYRRPGTGARDCRTCRNRERRK